MECSCCCVEYCKIAGILGYCFNAGARIVPDAECSFDPGSHRKSSAGCGLYFEPARNSFQEHDDLFSGVEFWRAVDNRREMSDAPSREPDRNSSWQRPFHRFQNVKTRDRPDLAVLPARLGTAAAHARCGVSGRGQLIETQSLKCGCMDGCSSAQQQCRKFQNCPQGHSY